MEQVNTVDKILKNLPDEVIGQKIYKTKVLFLDVKKDEAHYMKTKNFSSCGRNYSVVDGEISYLPEEAFSALSDAVTITRRYRDKRQEKDGIDHDNPNDNMIEEKNKRFDLTVIDTYTLVIEDGKKTFVSQNDTISAKVAEETANKIVEVKEKELREQIEEEFRMKYEDKIKDLQSKITPPVSDEELESLGVGNSSDLSGNI